MSTRSRYRQQMSPLVAADVIYRGGDLPEWPGWNNTPPVPWPGWNNTPPVPWPGWNNTPPDPWPGWTTVPPDYVASVIQTRASVPYTANADLTAVIPLDNTKPLVTEGTEILTVTLTPKHVSNVMRLRFRGEVTMPHSGACIAALFRTGITDALRAAYTIINDTNDVKSLALEVEETPGVLTPVTYTLRVGPSHGAMRMNGNSAGRLLGGAAAATMVVEEIRL